MRFTAKHLDYQIHGSFWDGKWTFSCREVFPSQNFDDPEKLVAALDAYNLKLRKSFSNPTAWRLGRRYTADPPRFPQEVTVTSIVDGGKEVWIKTSDGREKVDIQHLYADKDAVLKALAIEESAQKAIAEAWDACPNWAPQWKAPKPERAA